MQRPEFYAYEMFYKCVPTQAKHVAGLTSDMVMFNVGRTTMELTEIKLTDDYVHRSKYVRITDYKEHKKETSEFTLNRNQGESGTWIRCKTEDVGRVIEYLQLSEMDEAGKRLCG